MERHKKEKKHRTKPPRVPIKTYKWEDIRRARLRGGYPWTYLYKEPYNEVINAKLFIMEPSTRSKSSSALQASREGVNIKEITNGVEEHDNIHLTPEPSGYIVITEVPSDSENHSKSAAGGSLTIEDMEEQEVLNLESAESSDNISQYLDKEETPAEPTQAVEKSNVTEEASSSKNGHQDRAKSEEPKRKRKLSIDSSYSRKSLSKLAIMKKLKEAKDKIKTTKISLPNLNLPNYLKRQSSKKSQKESEKKSKPKDIMSYAQPSPQNETPVYIHIPLKPPEGQTDEFSYLEFGDKKPEEKPKPEESKPEESNIIEKKDQEEKQDRKQNDKKPSRPSSLLVDNQRRYSEHPDDIVAFEIVKTQSIDLPTPSRNEMYLLEPGDGRTGNDIMVYLPGPDEPNLSKSETNLSGKVPSRQNSKRIRAKSAEPERKRKLSAESSHSRLSLSKAGLLKKLKNATDKIKGTNFSLSRSNSKKEQQKKPKEEPNPPKETKKEPKKDDPSKSSPKYIHIPLKPPPGQTDEFSYLEFEEKKDSKEDKPSKTEPTEKEEQSSIESPTTGPNNPVQFIVLTPPSDDEILDHPDIPETPSSDDKPFFEGHVRELKAIARDAVDEISPESKKKKLDTVKEENGSEKPILKETDDKIQSDIKQTETKPETKKEEVPDEPQKVEKMVVDEEDGLKLTESAMAKQEQNIKAKELTEPAQELKSSLKTDGSPILRKKVSFKRKSRDDSKDGIYEDIQVPPDSKPKSKDEPKGTLAAMGNSQSMSVDEEKSYLDEKKIIKTTSLEEDYNRWSKLSDHEYEPINPPPDDNVLGSNHTSPLPSEQSPTVHVIDTSQEPQEKPLSVASSTTSLDRRMLGEEPEPTADESFSVQDMQSQIEEKYFGKTPESSSTQQTTVQTVSTTRSDTSTTETKKQPAKTKSEGPGRIQQAIKFQTAKLKDKLQGIKKPNIKLPSKPKISKPNQKKFKFEKPHINLPKMPEAPKINLPSFSLPRKNPLKRSLKQRQLSTESNAGDSKTSYFDFRTYPRLFKKKPKNDFDSSFSSRSEREVPEFATVPRTKRHNKEENDKWGGRDSIRIPLHPEESIEDHEREDSVERRMASHMRYDQDIDTEDAYERENQEIHTASPFSRDYNSRWNHGRFHPEPNLQMREDSENRQITDLDAPEDIPAPPESIDTNTSKDVHSSESSLGIHRRGVLEEIDSDEFFLRQKGISQDNIEVGMYLSSEIREAFKSPTNALADLQREPRDFPYDARGSNQSLPETPPKRKVIKKPKRKKTPHVSQEQITYDQDSEPEFTDIPPARPKRRSKRSKKPKDEQHNIIPYQETIAVEPSEENLGILSGLPDKPPEDEPEDEPEEYRSMYENERMEGKEQPEIQVTDPYAQFRYEEKYESDEEPVPAAPPRKQRSLKSLDYSEHDSIMGEFNLDKEPPPQNVDVYRIEHEYIIPTPEIPPTKPARTLSRSSSKSKENGNLQEEVVETPIRPVRQRSRSHTRSRGDSLNNEEEPCIEAPCVQDFRDCMGYAVIDKNIKREPPLPPPRTPPRRKRSTKSSASERRFFTVPRPLNDEPPARPIRNYSTLGPSRPPRRKPTVNMTDEEKENIDITQYIEIEDEPNRDLHSGEVIQKMRDRPLPAPPRPPRKTRTLQDITSQENIAIGSAEHIPTESYDDTEKFEILEETEVSTQTEPLPDDFVCEEIVREENARTEIPTKFQTEDNEAVTVKTRLITPTHYTYEEETITHGSLVVEPLNGAKILPDSEISQRETPTEKSIPITKDYDDETSEIPEEFTTLKNPTPSTQVSPQPSVTERPRVVHPDSSSEIEVLRAQKLQVSDLDVDRLSVNELLASKIIVSEIDSGSIQTNEISSKAGALKVGDIELPPGVIQQLFEKLQSVVQEHQSSEPTDSTPVAETSQTKEESEDSGQKKNSV